MNGVVWLGLGGGKHHNVTSIKKCLKEAYETLYLQRQNSKLILSVVNLIKESQNVLKVKYLPGKSIFDFSTQSPFISSYENGDQYTYIMVDTHQKLQPMAHNHQIIEKYIIKVFLKYFRYLKSKKCL